MSNPSDENKTGTRLSRRDVLKLGSLSALSTALGATFGLQGCATASTDTKVAGASSPAGQAGSIQVTGWESYSAVRARILPPGFPARDFNIKDYGAVEGGTQDATGAINKAIDACSAAGGGRVVVPDGTFITGAIFLKSNVNLHLQSGAVLKFYTDPAKYPVVFTRWEGIECMNYSPLIYAYEQRNIAVTGRGTLDGQASNANWWAWKANGTPVSQLPDQKKLIEMGNKGVPVSERVFGPGHFLRPNFIQPYRCENVLIEDVSIRQSPMWEIHPVLSRNVTVRGVNIVSHGPNNDGCDPESCRDVLIENCVFDTGDDCIAIKSGKNNDGRRVGVPSENIIVRGCQMKDGHGGVVLGSECSGHIRNVFVEDCNMDSPNLDRVLRFKNNAVRGGVLENVFVRNVTVGKVGEAIITIDFLYEEGANGDFKPVVRNVQMDKVTADAAPRIMYIVSFPGAEIDQIKLSNCVFKGVESTEVIATSGTISLTNVVIEPKNKPASLSTRGTL
ncbi:glycoside hydrolase family 28 protein [Uliginosibacterium sp. sgz301328]|uniref:glycoside hydrolase family 28 protein n=1 Tax=Uliginosibacterium sp. sgz301328 TaxID=3243764 RepID=UPI00359D2C52